MVNKKKTRQSSAGFFDEDQGASQSSSSPMVPNFASAVPKFNGENYDNFVFAFEHAMMAHGISAITEATSFTDEGYDERKNSLAVMLFMKNVEPQFITFVKKHQPFGAAWKALHEEYGKSTLMDQLALRAKWQQLRYDGKSIEGHFLQFDSIVNDLQSAGAEISNAEIINQFFLSLNQHFENVVESLQDKGDGITMAIIKKRIRSSLARKDPAQTSSILVEHSKDGKSSTTAFQTMYQQNNRGRGRGRSNRGRTYSNIGTRTQDNNTQSKMPDQNSHSNFGNSNSGNNQSSKSFFRGHCNYCHRYGHRISDCYKLNKTDTRKSDKDSQMFATVVDSFDQNPPARDTPVSFLTCYQTTEIEEDQAKFVSSNCSSQLSNNFNIISGSKTRFFLDSCANRHIIRDDKLFSDYIVLKTPLFVRVSKNGAGFFVIDYVKKGIISVKFSESSLMLADILTKGLARCKFSFLCDRLKIM